jgi:hypothetical protein
VVPAFAEPARVTSFCLNAIRTIGCSTPGIVVLGSDQINDIAGLPLPNG